jgi:hypothetical protein
MHSGRSLDTSFSERARVGKVVAVNVFPLLVAETLVLWVGLAATLVVVIVIVAVLLFGPSASGRGPAPASSQP